MAAVAGTVRRQTVSAKLMKVVRKKIGEVSERFKEHAWKACVGEILPWVQIPPSPPFLSLIFLSLIFLSLNFMLSVLVAAVRGCLRKRYIHSHVNLYHKSLFMRILK